MPEPKASPLYRPLLLAGVLLLAGCTNSGTPERFLTKYADPDPSLDAVLVCHGYGCQRQDTVDLRQDWARLVAGMTQPAPDAAAERASIALTIAAIEAEVGARVGTSEDVGCTFEGFAMPGQLDCIDETSNTSSYLILLDKAGLLRWHEVRGQTSRFFVHNGWPHTTAVIVETATGQAYAVDSWFHDNGQPAEIVTIESWKSGWAPDAVMVAAAQAPDDQGADEAEGEDIADPAATLDATGGSAALPAPETPASQTPASADAAGKEEIVQTYVLLDPRGPDPARPPRPRP